jgi:hypothetical protein
LNIPKPALAAGGFVVAALLVAGGAALVAIGLSDADDDEPIAASEVERHRRAQLVEAWSDSDITWPEGGLPELPESLSTYSLVSAADTAADAQRFRFLHSGHDDREFDGETVASPLGVSDLAISDGRLTATWTPPEGREAEVPETVELRPFEDQAESVAAHLYAELGISHGGFATLRSPSVDRDNGTVTWTIGPTLTDHNGAVLPLAATITMTIDPMATVGFSLPLLTIEEDGDAPTVNTDTDALDRAVAAGTVGYGSTERPPAGVTFDSADLLLVANGDALMWMWRFSDGPVHLWIPVSDDEHDPEDTL